MSSPLIWVVIPSLASIGLFLIMRFRKWTYISGIGLSIILTFAAKFVPIESVVDIGLFEYKISGTLNVLGRQLILNQDRQAILIMVFAIISFWLIGAFSTSAPSIIVPISLLACSFLVGSVAVDPFLYAAIFIEIAVLITIPLLTNNAKMVNKGIIRFLTFQTIGMVFLLFTGWLLGGQESAPASREAAIRSLIFLGLGFAFVLAIFPFYSWIPMLAEHEDSYSVGFILILYPTLILLFGITFLEKYSWLRNSIELKEGLQIMGTLMVISGGVWSAFQKHLGRMFGYAVIVENGLSLIAIGTMTVNGFQIFASLFLPRILSFGVWTICLSLIQKKYGSLELNKMLGIGKSETIIIIGILAAQFSIGGLPLLAGFPLRVAILEEIVLQSVVIAWAIVVGIAGIWAAGLYSLSIFLRSETGWKNFFTSNSIVNILLSIGVVTLIVMGIFPQLYSSSISKLLLSYSHLR